MSEDVRTWPLPSSSEDAELSCKSVWGWRDGGACDSGMFSFGGITVLKCTWGIDVASRLNGKPLCWVLSGYVWSVDVRVSKLALSSDLAILHQTLGPTKKC